MTSSADKIAKKRAKDLEEFKRQRAKRREQAQNAQTAGSGNDAIVTEEPPPPPTSSSTILTTAVITASTMEEPPPPPTSSSTILSSAVAASMEEGSEDTTLPPSVSSQHAETQRRKSTNTDMEAAIARKKSDLSAIDSASQSISKRRKNKAHVTFDSSALNPPDSPPRPQSSDSMNDPGSPNTSASSHYASTISSLTTDSFIERKRQTMDWPSVLPEEEEDLQATATTENEEEFQDHPNNTTTTSAAEVAAYPPPSAPPLLDESIPVIHVEATPVFEDDYNDNLNGRNHHKRKNPFKDWRVLVFIMITISTIVGLSVGLVMKNTNGNNGSTSSAVDSPPTTPDVEEETAPAASRKVTFSFSIELSTSDANSIDKDTLVNVTKAHMEEAMTGIVDSFEDIDLSVTLQTGSSDGDERTIDQHNNDHGGNGNGRRRRRLDVVTAIFDAVVTLKDDSDIPTDESAFVDDVLSTSFSSNQRESLVKSMGNAGLNVTALSLPVALVVVNDNAASKAPTLYPSPSPSPSLSGLLTDTPSDIPTATPSYVPSKISSQVPTSNPSMMPVTESPTPPPGSPTKSPSVSPSIAPSVSVFPTTQPSAYPSVSPSASPTISPSLSPTLQASNAPSGKVPPAVSPITSKPSTSPTLHPSSKPTSKPSAAPSYIPTSNPTPKTSTPAGNTKTIQTSVDKKFSRSGAMFDVTSLTSSLTITAMDILIDLTLNDVGDGDIEVEVWTRNGGSYKSFETDEAAWTWRNNKQPYAISSDILKEVGTGKNLEERILSIGKDIFDPVVIPSGQTIGFYVTLRLKSGILVGQSSFVDEDDNLRIAAGTSNSYRFGIVNNPRNWNGALKYVLN